MNSDLESIYIWSKQWLVNFNPQKIKAMVFSNINLPNDVEITFQDKLVKLVASHKHLGITFDSNGKLNTHIVNIIKSASQRLCALRKFKYVLNRHYLDDVLSINNSRFAEFLPLIYPPELEVKETTDTASSTSFLDLYLEFDGSGQISTKMYDKRDDFNFKIINFPNMCSNIPASPAYGVYISQLIRYARASSNYSDFLKRHLHLRNRLLDQGYKKIRLIRSLKKFIFRYQDLVEIYSVSAETIINDGFSYSENV
jgi:hypothetical protein